MKLNREYLLDHIDGTRAMNPEGTALWAEEILKVRRDLFEEREVHFITTQRCVKFRKALQLELDEARRCLKWLEDEAPPGRLGQIATERERVRRLEEVLDVGVG
jgi:hypothetical protein